MQNEPFMAPPRPMINWRRVFLRWLISSLAIFAAVWLVPGISFSGPGWQIGVVALVFGLLNVLLRPLLYCSGW
jgi:putative membrane protein